MPQASPSSQEYWRPANPDFVRLFEPTPAAVACWRCGAEYSPAARFCHMCGCSRDASMRSDSLLSEKKSLGQQTRTRPFPFRLPLPLTSLLCFVLGIACLAGAGLMGVIYKTDTLVDWQAVQTWRIEWLLAASAAMLAGILLKKVE